MMIFLKKWNGILNILLLVFMTILISAILFSCMESQEENCSQTDTVTTVWMPNDESTPAPEEETTTPASEGETTAPAPEEETTTIDPDEGNWSPWV